MAQWPFHFRWDQLFHPRGTGIGTTEEGACYWQPASTGSPVAVELVATGHSISGSLR